MLSLTQFPEISLKMCHRWRPFTNNGMYHYQVMNEILHNVGSIDVPVRLSLPTIDSLLRVVNFPNMSLYEAKLAFRYEFENYFPFPIEEGVYDLGEILYPLQNGSEESRYLVAATRKALIENITKAAKANGIEITAIEPAQIALERAVAPLTPVSDASVYIYAARQGLSLFSRGRQRIFFVHVHRFRGFFCKRFLTNLNAEYTLCKGGPFLAAVCSLSWRFQTDRSVIWAPGHPDLCDFLRNPVRF